MNFNSKIKLLTILLFTSVCLFAQTSTEINNDIVVFSTLEKKIMNQSKSLNSDKDSWVKDNATYYKTYEESGKTALIQAYNSRPDLMTVYFFESSKLKYIKLFYTNDPNGDLKISINDDYKYSISGSKDLLYMPITYLYNQGEIAFEKMKI